MSKSVLVIHHSADFDGIACREIAKKALKDEADYVGFDHGQPVPDISKYSTVYLLDISLPIEVMRENARKIVLIDHHKTLISAVEPFKDQFAGYYCIDGVAACRLAYQWFHVGLPPTTRKEDFVERKVFEPYAIQLLGEYDIWDKRNPDTDLFQLGLLGQTFADWSALLMRADGAKYLVQKIVEKGKVIQEYTDVVNAQISQERGFDIVFEGLTFRALNTARCNSLTFTASILPHHDGCLGYYWNGKFWKFSLYGVPHKPDIDLSIIAKKMGGGGHKQACGFELKELPAEFGKIN